MPTNPYSAQRLFEQQSREAYKRNQKCVCEMSDLTLIVKTKRRGAKRLNLGGTSYHLTSCQHSELARTTQPDKPAVRRRSFYAEIPMSAKRRFGEAAIFEFGEEDERGEADE